VTGKSQPFSIAMLLDGKGAARDLTAEEVTQWQEGDGILWLDIDLMEKAGKQWLSNEGSLDKSVQSILLAAETRPRSLVEGDSLIVVLRGINMNPGSVPDDMVAVRMALQENRIISTRRRTVLSVSDMRESLLAGKGPKSPADFLIAITGFLSTRIESAVENIENLVADLDEQMADRETDDVRVTLGVIRRQAAAIRRHLAPQRDAIDRIARSDSGLLSDRHVFDLREEGDQLTRHIEDLDLARENALVTQEELMNRTALEQNARMYLLSVVAAIFLPLTFITGLLGMNVAGLPGTENPYGFIYSALIMVASLAGLVLYFRSRKWL